ncbi:MAG: hypothetical protein ABFD65_13945 [Candidatus Polarisedimenticolia bacterium]
MGHKASVALADAMKQEPRDFTLDEIYRMTCRPPHQELMTADQLHRRVSRYVGEARRLLKPTGYLLILGEKRHSYRAVKRKPVAGK